MSTATSRLEVTCRRARPEDTPAVIALTSQIWEGHDYVPLVWEEWLADPQGYLVVAEAAGQIVGTGRLTRLSENDWWLEGLRVAPACEGRGVASQIHDHLVQSWLENGAGALRLVTASHRQAVHHLCQRDGFLRLLELSWFHAPALEPDDNLQTEIFTPVAMQELEQAFVIARQSSGLTLTAGLIDMLWRWARLRREFLEESLTAGHLFWWRNRQGLFSVVEDYDEPEGEHWPVLQFAGCPRQALQQYLQDFRLLAGVLGYQKAYWNAPLLPEVEAALQVTSFQSEEEHSIYLFAKEHPERGENFAQR